MKAGGYLRSKRTLEMQSISMKRYHALHPNFTHIEIKGWPQPRDYAKLEAVREAGEEIWMYTNEGLKIFEREAICPTL